MSYKLLLTIFVLLSLGAEADPVTFNEGESATFNFSFAPTEDNDTIFLACYCEPAGYPWYGGVTTIYDGLNGTGEIVLFYPSSLLGAGAFSNYPGMQDGLFSIVYEFTNLTIGTTATTFRNGVPTITLLNVDTDGVLVVPEPATLALFSAGLLGLGFMRRRKQI